MGACTLNITSDPETLSTSLAQRIFQIFKYCNCILKPLAYRVKYFFCQQVTVKKRIFSQNLCLNNQHVFYNVFKFTHKFTIPLICKLVNLLRTMLNISKKIFKMFFGKNEKLIYFVQIF